MKTGLIFLALMFLVIQVQAETECLGFFINAEGKAIAKFPRQIVDKPNTVLGDYDSIKVTLNPANPDNDNNIPIEINNDGRTQVMVGQTVWMSGEFLSKTNNAYWILIDCAPAEVRSKKIVGR